MDTLLTIKLSKLKEIIEKSYMAGVSDFYDEIKDFEPNNLIYLNVIESTYDKLLMFEFDIMACINDNVEE